VKRAAKKRPAARKPAGPRAARVPGAAARVPGAAAYIVEIEVDPAAEAPWFRWEIDEHIPEVLAEPGFLDATFYRIDGPGDWPLYQVLYRLESREALDAYLSGEAVQRLRKEAMAMRQRHAHYPAPHERVRVHCADWRTRRPSESIGSTRTTTSPAARSGSAAFQASTAFRTTHEARRRDGESVLSLDARLGMRVGPACCTVDRGSAAWTSLPGHRRQPAGLLERDEVLYGTGLIGTSNVPFVHRPDPSS
jgi:quinol monooxygenase YgiN